MNVAPGDLWMVPARQRMRYLLIATLLASTASAAPPTTCDLAGDYEQALCSYQKRSFAAAEAGFRSVAERPEQSPETTRALYFLARTMMKTGRYQEATAILIRIYGLDKPFYDGWNCDFLLGECRRALGQ